MRGYLIHCVTIPAAQNVFSLLFMYKECDLFMYLFICYQIKHLIIIILDKKKRLTEREGERAPIH